jgi:hypothetical protein
VTAPSASPLARKLGLKAGMTVRLLDPPDGYWRIIGDSPAGLQVIVMDAAEETRADFTHLFATGRQAIREAFADARAGMATDGMVWASWPKKASGVASEVARAEVMAAGKAAGLVDVKVAAVDEIWSGLKFVIPLDGRGP